MVISERRLCNNEVIQDAACNGVREDGECRRVVTHVDQVGSRHALQERQPVAAPHFCLHHVRHIEQRAVLPRVQM